MARAPALVLLTVLAFAAPAQVGAQAGAVIEFRGADDEYGYGRPASRADGAAPVRQASVIDVRRARGAGPAQSSQSAQAANPQAAAVASAAPPAQRPAWLAEERVGAPYQAHGRWYAPSPEPGYEERGRAVRYPPERRAGTMAAGEAYDPRALSAAHPTLPIPSLVQVSDPATGRDVILRVLDRGPFAPGAVIALSDAAAELLGVGARGGEVHVRYLGPAPRRIAAATPPAAVRRASVQVAVFSSRDNAERARAQLAALGPVAVEQVPQSGRAAYRVQLGPWSDRAAAEEARAGALRLGFSGSRLIEG